MFIFIDMFFILEVKKLDEQYYINCIVKGIERYFRIFAQSGIVHNHLGSIEWIKPIQGEVAVFRVPIFCYAILFSSLSLGWISYAVPCRIAARSASSSISFSTA